MPFKKKPTKDTGEEIVKDDIDVTEELCYAVAEAVINRDDIIKTISKTTKCTNARAVVLQKEVLSSPLYKQIFEDYKNTMKGTVYDDDRDTIMLQYNNLIRKATQEKKYEVVVRILDKIRMLQAIGDKEMEFKMVFGFDPVIKGSTFNVNFNLIDEDYNKKK